jgi:hypothetical protein
MATASSSTDDFPTLIGDLYARWTLDSLTEIVYAIAGDAIVRPQLYQSDDIPDGIVALRMSWGTAPDLPNHGQRQAMISPIFGRSDGLRSDTVASTASFHQARKKLVDAAVAFSERAVDTGISMLEDRVRSALIPLRAHFEGLRGKSVRLTAQQIRAESKIVVDVLTSGGIARAFGVTAAEKGWPFTSNDANGAKLVEAAGATLALGPDHKMGYTRFILLQRVAAEGGRALATALGDVPDTSKDLQALVSQLYTWGASLRDFQQTV